MRPNINYVSENPAYNKAKEIYNKLCEAFVGADALYEDTIVIYCGRESLELLREYNFIELCASFNGRKLYAIHL